VGCWMDGGLFSPLICKGQIGEHMRPKKTQKFIVSE
jgi:hypothetical protein